MIAAFVFRIAAPLLLVITPLARLSRPTVVLVVGWLTAELSAVARAEAALARDVARALALTKSRLGDESAGRLSATWAVHLLDEGGAVIHLVVDLLRLELVLGQTKIFSVEHPSNLFEEASAAVFASAAAALLRAEVTISSVAGELRLLDSSRTFVAHFSLAVAGRMTILSVGELGACTASLVLLPLPGETVVSGPTEVAFTLPWVHLTRHEISETGLRRV